MLLVAFASLVVTQDPAPAPAVADAPERAKALRIGVATLDATDVEARTAQVVEDALLVELRKLQKTSVLGMSEIRQMLDLEAEKQSLGCATDSCLAEIADAVGVDVLVTGTLAKVGDESVFGLKRIDQREAKVTATITKRLVPAGGEEFLAAIGPAVEELFPDVAVRNGVTRGVPPETALRLNPPPLPWFAPFAAGALAGTLLVGSGVAAVVRQVDQARYKELANENPVNGAELVATGRYTQTAEAVMWTLLGTGALAALATGAMIPFTNFAEEEQ